MEPEVLKSLDTIIQFVIPLIGIAVIFNSMREKTNRQEADIKSINQKTIEHSDKQKDMNNELRMRVHIIEQSLGKFLTKEDFLSKITDIVDKHNQKLDDFIKHVDKYIDCKLDKRK